MLGYFRIFTIASGATDSIYGITIQKGLLDEDDGAGILNEGTLYLAAVNIIYNTSNSGYGGGIYNDLAQYV